jgi:hypothetical protein
MNSAGSRAFAGELPYAEPVLRIWAGFLLQAVMLVSMD